MIGFETEERLKRFVFDRFVYHTLSIIIIIVIIIIMIFYYYYYYNFFYNCFFSSL